MFEQLVSSDLGTAKTDDLPIMILVKHRAKEMMALSISEEPVRKIPRDMNEQLVN